MSETILAKKTSFPLSQQNKRRKKKKKEKKNRKRKQICLHQANAGRWI
jgi:hypothetical protein